MTGTQQPDHSGYFDTPFKAVNVPYFAAVNDRPCGESAVFTRWYNLNDLLAVLPPELELVELAGVRVATVAAAVHRVPVVKGVMRRLEFALRDSALGRFGGFLVLELRRV